MLQYTTTIQRFDNQGEKTGWSYISISASQAQKLLPGNKKGFRVKGSIDQYTFEAVSVLPMGDGSFIMPVNATVRKAIKKQKGATVKLKIEVDNNPEPVKMIPELQECLEDAPAALAYWEKLPRSHRHYWIKWIDSAKTEATRTKRIAQAVIAMERRQDYGTAMRAIREEKKDLLG